ncbi:MAG: hypothetical protein GWO02_08610, partial [Gammaproteobacteria bacterium]|nr:hypothetical protein [Gammaproteobacteria bacterium]
MRADFEFTAASESVLLFTQIPGQRVDGLRFESAGVEIMPEREQRSSAIMAYRLPAGTAQGAVSVAYEIDSDAGAAYRFAL